MGSRQSETTGIEDVKCLLLNLFNKCKNILSAFTANTSELIQQIISSIISIEKQNAILAAVKNFIKEHPYITAASAVGLILAIVLMANPVGLAGFGTLGPVAGSFAASIQGPAVAAGSAFAVFQSIGMTWAVPVFASVGAALATATTIGFFASVRKFWKSFGMK